MWLVCIVFDSKRHSHIKDDDTLHTALHCTVHNSCLVMSCQISEVHGMLVFKW